MITVWSVCVGDKYTDDDVRILKAMVAKNMEAPHVFRCLTDRQIDGVYCNVLDNPWPGWWSKLLLFKYSRGPNLYLDLDVVIVGGLDRLLSGALSMPANWGQSGHGGCQSSVMSWEGSYSLLPDMFDPGKLAPPERGNCGAYGGRKLWGDQEYITDILGNPGDGEVVPMDHVYSYKYHCGNGVPADASVICFHGDPKPNKVSDQWVTEARSYTVIAA